MSAQQKRGPVAMMDTPPQMQQPDYSQHDEAFWLRQDLEDTHKRLDAAELNGAIGWTVAFALLVAVVVMAYAQGGI